ncbi:LysR family transcriptional regulator [Poseidonocella sp. HB161398]|uniref:LysR family transcriptional regulator n=1 Tax=Poseidonocella sp. HB161398 TaxID=2320855 RepID=UPI00148698A5|nr:LysR family transcriptional regulator [Poseidonocella sp. HB161398]
MDTALDEAGETGEARIESKLAGFDLNLLVALEALVVCRNVTHAARRVGQTQPAMSRALARLRDMLSDDLLVRGSAGMQLTARGEYLARHLPASMAHLRDILEAREAAVEVKLTISGHLSPILLPRFLRDAPSGNTTLRVGTHRTAAAAMDQLRARTADFMIGSDFDIEPELRTRLLCSEDFVTLVANEGYLQTGAGSDLARFLELRHAVLCEDGAECYPQVAQALVWAGISRARLVRVEGITSAGLMASQGDVALTVPQSIAAWLQQTVKLNVVQAPLEIAKHRIRIGWIAQELEPDYDVMLDKIGISARAALIPGRAGAARRPG